MYLDLVRWPIDLHCRKKVVRIINRGSATNSSVPRYFKFKLTWEHNTVNDVVRPDVIPEVRLTQTAETELEKRIFVQ